MSWHGIVGHDHLVEQFRRAVRRERLASSFLFVGPEGVGKRSFALKLAQAFLCQTRPEEELDPCGACPGCLQVAAQTHPDLEVVGKPADKSFIPLELLIGDQEHRMRQGLCFRLSLKPFMGGRKVAIIDDADWLNAEGANCLLKTLEEPPPRSVLILIGTSPAKQLPTIRSRCQLIRFRPLRPDVVADLLVSQQLVGERAEALRLAAYGEGSIRRALELADAELWAFRDRLYEQLAEPMLDATRLGQAIVLFVEEAGKEVSARRRRMRQVLQQAAEFYRQLLRRLSGVQSNVDEKLHAAVEKALPFWQQAPWAAGESLERCLDALEQVDRNVYPAILLDCWMHDLAHMIPSPANRRP